MQSSTKTDPSAEPSHPFANKVALVTGATSGIGKATAEALLRRGAKVVVNHHSKDEKSRQTEEEFLQILHQANRPSEDLKLVCADISTPSEVKAMYSEIDDDFKRLDILVNNAGFETECPSHQLDFEKVEKELSVNLSGHIWCSVEALKRFLQNAPTQGCIVNNSSVHQEIPKPGFLAYSIAKGGMQNLTRTLALEYADQGIRVNAVGPGVVNTPMNAALQDSERRRQVQQHIPQGSAIAPEEIAQCIPFLASDHAQHITGQTLMIDGGLTLYPDFKDNWSS